MQTFKDALQAATAAQTTARILAYEFLCRYRITPHGTTGTTPALLLLDRLPRIKLDMLHPDPANVFRKHQEAAKERFDAHAQERHFSDRDEVFARNYSGRLRWKAGVVRRQTGHASYDAQVGQSVEHRHADQLRKSLVNMPNKSIEEQIQDDFVSEFNNQQSPRDKLAIQHEQPEQLTAPILHEQHLALPFQGPPLVGHPERPAIKTPVMNGSGCNPASEREPLRTQPLPTVPAMPERSNFRDRNTLQSKMNFSDEYSGLGSKSQPDRLKFLTVSRIRLFLFNFILVYHFLIFRCNYYSYLLYIKHYRLSIKLTGKECYVVV